MFGWSSLRRPASAWKRADVGVGEEGGADDLEGDEAFHEAVLGRSTTPMPPRPNSRTMRNFGWFANSGGTSAGGTDVPASICWGRPRPAPAGGGTTRFGGANFPRTCQAAP